MNIAIIGAGLSGLGTAWHLLNSTKFSGAKLCIFDKKGVGGGASSVSAGMLHPYGGTRAKMNVRGREGMEATLELLEAASEALGRPVFTKSGLLRLATNEEQKFHFKACADNYEDVQWLSAEECQAIAPGVALNPGIFIREAYSVSSSDYLQGLFLACKQLGAELCVKEVEDLRELDHFDLIIATLGSDTASIQALNRLPIGRIKGQILEFDWPSDLSPLNIPLSSDIYMIMSPDKKSCIVGTTFERNFSSEETDMQSACDLILPKLHSIFPPLQGISPARCRAGVRATAPNRLPLTTRLNNRCWVLAGLGSKGLLYHALYSKELVDAMCEFLR